MKRQSMLDRLAFVSNKQDDLRRAAREFVTAEASTSYCARAQVARNLDAAAVELGMAVKRYLGGREK